MKYILLSILLWSCGNTSMPSFKHKSPDTTFTVKVFVSTGDSIRYDPIYRITKDTFAFTDIDSATKVKRWVRDTAYYIPVKGKYVLTIRDAVYPGEDLTKAIAVLTKWVNDHRPARTDSAKGTSHRALYQVDSVDTTSGKVLYKNKPHNK